MIIEELTQQDLERFDFTAYGHQVKSVVEANAKVGIAFAARAEDKVLAMGGIVELWHGVGDAWTIFALCMHEHWWLWPHIHRMVKVAIKGFFDDAGGHRLQTAVLAGWKQGQEWLYRLGFHFEGMMEKYGPDRRDYERWAMVKGG